MLGSSKKGMKYYYHLLFYSLIFTTCQRGLFQKPYIDNEKRFTVTKYTYTGATFLDTLYYTTGEIQAIGTFAIDNYADTSFIKAGYWKEYFTNGQLKAEGNYQIGTYLQCCTGGYCRIYYNYKDGPWKYWYENGQLKAQGTYVTLVQYFRTSCKGGDQVRVHKVTQSWQFFDEKGNVATVSDVLIKELEEVDFYRLSH